MDLPISADQLAVLRRRYTVFLQDHRVAFCCHSCAIVFLVSPALLPGENYSGLCAHAKTCTGPGAGRGVLPGELTPGR